MEIWHSTVREAWRKETCSTVGDAEVKDCDDEGEGTGNVTAVLREKK